MVSWSGEEWGKGEKRNVIRLLWEREEWEGTGGIDRSCGMRVLGEGMMGLSGRENGDKSIRR